MEANDDTLKRPRTLRDMFPQPVYDFLERVKAEFMRDLGQGLNARDIHVGGTYWVQYKTWIQSKPRMRRLTVVELPQDGADAYLCEGVNGDRMVCKLASFVSAANSM